MRVLVHVYGHIGFPNPPSRSHGAAYVGRRGKRQRILGSGHRTVQVKLSFFAHLR